MNRTPWYLVALAATQLFATACKDGGKEDGTDTPADDTIDTRPDTAETAIPLPEFEFYSRSISFAYDPDTNQAITVEGPDGDVLPGVFYRAGEESVFQSGSGDYCLIQVISEDPIDLAEWNSEIDGYYTFQIEATEDNVLIGCTTDFDPVSVQDFLDTRIMGLWHGGGIVMEHDNDVEDFIEDILEADTNEYLPAGFYLMDEAEFDDDEWAATGYASGYEIEDGEIVIDDDELVEIDATELIAIHTPPVETDTETDSDSDSDSDTETEPPPPVPEPIAAYYAIGEIYYYGPIN